MTIRRVKNKNPFPQILKRINKGQNRTDKVVEHYVALVAKIARESMKKAPKRPKSRFGTYGRWGKGRKKGEYFLRKGQYSPPGKPPYYHTDRKKSGKATLRNIKYFRKSRGHWVVGPVYLGGFGTPIPKLHEYGGTKTQKAKSYRDNLGKKHIRPFGRIARYPPRPYMRPAAKTALKRRRGNKSFMQHLSRFGGMKPKKVRISTV